MHGEGNRKGTDRLGMRDEMKGEFSRNVKTQGGGGGGGVCVGGWFSNNRQKHMKTFNEVMKATDLQQSATAHMFHK